MDKKKSVKKNKTDFLVSTAKSIVGAAPFIGSLMTELIDNLIPNQRIERLSKFIIELDNKLAKYEKEFIHKQLANEDFSDLLEEGLKQSTRALSNERRQYIASIIENSLNQEQINYNEAKYLMCLLDNLNDVEIIWLRSYWFTTREDHSAFLDKHKDVLEPVWKKRFSRQISIDKEALQDSYQERLERLGLIKSTLDFDTKTGIPVFEKFTGTPKISHVDLTSLGILLLRFIGLANE